MELFVICANPTGMRNCSPVFAWRSTSRTPALFMTKARSHADVRPCPARFTAFVTSAAIGLGRRRDQGEAPEPSRPAPRAVRRAVRGAVLVRIERGQRDRGF